MDKEIVTAVAIGIGLSASCGFRVFVPMLVAAIAARMGIFPAGEGFEWLSGWPAIITFGSATIFEIFAYYIPFIDNLLDTITTPLAVGAGTLLVTSVLPIDSGLLKWSLGFIIGGGAAATIKGGSVLTRLASSKFTAGAVNPVVATGEHAAAFGVSVTALFLPLIVTAIVVLLIVYIIRKLAKNLPYRKNRRKQEGLKSTE